MRSSWQGRTVAMAILMAWCGLHVTGNAADGTNGTLYVTWPPIEPDKAIAAWLIKTFVNPDARFVFVERGISVSEGIPFDIPGSAYIRDQRRCTSEAIIQSFNIQDEKAGQLASLARRIEFAYWATSFTEEETYLINRIGNISSAATNYESALSRAFELIDKWPSE